MAADSPLYIVKRRKVGIRNHLVFVYFFCEVNNNESTTLNHPGWSLENKRIFYT